MPRRNRGRDRRRQRPTPGYTWVGNKLVPIATTDATKPVVPENETPSWANMGGGGHENAPGTTEVPSFEETIQQHQETQQAAAIQERESSILTTHEPSQAEKDYYAALEAGKDPVITRDHLDQIGVTEKTAEELAEPKTEEEIAEDNAPENQPVENAPGFTSEHNAYIDPETGEKKFQTREQWSASIGDDAISVGPTDTTPNALAGGSLTAGGKSSASSEGGGYGKKRVAQQSRKQMNLTQGRNRSLLTSI